MKIKKWGKMLFLLFVVCFACCGCNGTITRNIRHAGFTVGDTFVCDPFYPKDKEDTHYERVKYFTGSHLINSEGKIYELALSQPYANGQNCREAQTTLREKAILDNRIIKAEDNKYYYLVSQNNVASYSEVPQTDNNYTIYDILLRDEDVIKVMTADNSKGVYYVLKQDGNIYANVIQKPDRNGPFVLTSTQVIFDKTEYLANIIDFNYVGNSLNTYVKTENKMFRMRMKNAERCQKYADVVCEFELKEDTMFETYKDHIILYNGNMLVTDYKQIFTVEK